MNELYKRIRTLCEERGTSVSALAQQVGVSPQRLSVLKLDQENKKTLAASTLYGIAKQLNTTMEFLLTGDDPTVIYVLDQSGRENFKSIAKRLTRDEIISFIQVLSEELQYKR